MEERLCQMWEFKLKLKNKLIVTKFYVWIFGLSLLHARDEYKPTEVISDLVVVNELTNPVV